MLKFFRKYNKIILVVGGSILMVLFLLPAGVSQMLGGGLATPVARLDGRTISIGEMNQKARELQVIAALAPELLQIIGADPRSSEHWMLLSEAAQRGGLVGGPSEGEAFIPEMAETAVEWTLFLISRQDPGQAAQLRARRGEVVQSQMLAMRTRRDQLNESGMPFQEIDQILAVGRGVLRLLELNNTASLFSTRTAVQIGKQFADYASISFVNVPAASRSVDIELTPEMLDAHFEEYKAVDPASDPYGIGYLQPDMVSVEWLTIDRIAVENRLVLDPIEVNKFWRQNRDRFADDFSTSQINVEIAYRRMRGNVVFDRINELIRRRLHASTVSLEGDSRYKSLPPDWESRQPSLPQLANELEAAITQEFGLADGLRLVSYAGPLTKQSAQNLSVLPGLGQASLRMGDSVAMPFPQYVMSVREIAGDNRFGVQKGLVYGPLESPNGSQFYFRITEVRPSGPPDSLSEVRTQAQPNLRILLGMERLAAEVDEIRQRAIENGIASLRSETGAEFTTDVEVTRETVRHSVTQQQFPLVNVPVFRDAVMDQAEKLDPTIPTTDIPINERVVTVLTPAAKSLIVAEILGYRPLTAERYRQIAIPVRFRANASEASEGAFDTYSLENLTKRFKFERIGEEPKVESLSDEEAPQTP